MTDTENLREQFEAWARKSELEAERHKYADDQYDDRAATSAWWAWRDAYQAGHAAAKAETADVGEPAAWMAVLTHPRSQGPQAHFVSDAKLASQWKYNGVVDGEPCIVQSLFTAPQLAAAVAQERERAARVCERIADDYNQREGLKCAELKTDAETGANECADAIRAGAKEPSDG